MASIPVAADGSWSVPAFRAAVLARGFAVLALPPPSAAALAVAAAAAAAFFELPTAEKEDTRAFCDEAAAAGGGGGAKGLVGFNRVSLAKEVFRVRRQRAGAAPVPPSAAPAPVTGEVVKPAAKRQRSSVGAVVPDAVPGAGATGGGIVWPAEERLSGFRAAVEAGWAVLEDIVHRSAAALLGGQGYATWLREGGRMAAGQRLSASPLDLFYYPNDGFASSTANCVDHKDPGWVLHKDPFFCRIFSSQPPTRRSGYPAVKLSHLSHPGSASCSHTS